MNNNISVHGFTLLRQIETPNLITHPGIKPKVCAQGTVVYV
jgi:hypothetical protein